MIGTIEIGMGTSKEDLEKQLKKEEDLKKFILLQENEKRDQQQNEEYNQLLAQYGHEIVKNPSILQPVKGKEEEVDKSKLPMQDEFYIQSKKKGNNKEEKKQGSRYLVKDFGTSKSPKSTRQRAKYFGRDCPASGTLR